MPDWFYRTVSQPVLFALPAPQARDSALGFIGRLARLPFGPYLIDFLGHMRADPRLRRSLLGIDFPTAVGLGPWLDTRLVAIEALSRFGVGFIEVGPVSVEGSEPAVKRLREQEALWIGAGSISLAECNRRLRRAANVKVPVIVRLDHTENEASRLISELDSSVRLVSIPLETSWTLDRWSQHLDSMTAAARSASTPRHLLLCVDADHDFDVVKPLIEMALSKGVGGLLVDGSLKSDAGGRLVGLPVREQSLLQVRRLRQLTEAPLIASGGIHEPEHALELLSAGADLIQVDTGLIYTGPGLPKRINDSLLYETTRHEPLPAVQRFTELTWFWTTLMGAGMMIGGVLALIIAATKVVLPYDEAYLGMSLQQLTTIN